MRQILTVSSSVISIQIKEFSMETMQMPVVHLKLKKMERMKRVIPVKEPVTLVTPWKLAADSVVL